MSYELYLRFIHKDLSKGKRQVRILQTLFVLVVFMVIFVNGFTDAPSAIAGCISSRSMSLRGAILLAGVFNFLGAFISSLVTSGVAQTVYYIVDFGDDSALALRAIFAGMCAVVVWALIAFLFGIPTSESHALVAGIVGAALGSSMSFYSLNFNYIGLVLIGLLVSTVPAYYISKLIYYLILRICREFDRRKTMKYFSRTQRASAALSAFMHGAQDSQKFAGVLMLGMSLYVGEGSRVVFEVPPRISLMCALIMTVGTLCGGSRIIKKLGAEMVRLDAAASTAADGASSFVLGICTLLGIPVSTTHSKTCAMMGAGVYTLKGVDRGVVREMIVAWLLTFPFCSLLGFIFGFILK